ncbi:MAG: diphthamide biosynthesis enzyme Dph2 [Thermoplasmata archaeon]|nr:MAG: diphthamide biosynthesis enzyme Dph2 [Thermoplasmata archaeon]
MIGNSKSHDTKKFDYDLRLQEIFDTVMENRYKIILIQFPEGLKKIATDVRDIIEERTDATVIISADPCFGACDIPLSLSDLKIDLLVQFGHSNIPNITCSVPTMFIEAQSDLDVIPIVKKAMKHLNGTVGIISTVQHIHKLQEVKNFLTKNGFSTRIGKGSFRSENNGQVLGCDISSATTISSLIDCYLFIGSGNFHALGVAIVTKKPVFIADPYQNEVRETGSLIERFLRQRHGAIARAKDASSYGILVGTKPGQTRLEMAYELKKLLEKHQKKGYILILNQFSPIHLKPFKIDAYVSTACPRIAIDDYLMYEAPMLTPQELRIVLGEAKWEDYKFDEII